jgi:multicomponent Na+:H+ antiporter subunit B
MNSIILRTATRYMLPLLILFSVFLLLRGHNQSGGGFAGGLVAAAAFALYSLSYDAQTARKVLRFQPFSLIALGLFTALASGFIGVFSGSTYLTGVWGYLYVPGIGNLELGTPLMFDIGVYFLVTGVMLILIFTLEEVE